MMIKNFEDWLLLRWDRRRAHQIFHTKVSIPNFFSLTHQYAMMTKLIHPSFFKVLTPIILPSKDESNTIQLRELSMRTILHLLMRKIINANFSRTLLTPRENWFDRVNFN